jgi:hypothetical protein
MTVEHLLSLSVLGGAHGQGSATSPSSGGEAPQAADRDMR